MAAAVWDLVVTVLVECLCAACKVGGSVIGITIGGLLGLMPLLWIANPDMPPKPQAIA